MKTTTWISALLLLTSATSIGCGEARSPHATTEARPAAPAATEQAAQVAPPAAPATACPTPPATPEKTSAAREASTKAASAEPASKPQRRASAPAKLKVKRLLLTEQIKDREPVEPRSAFEAAEAGRIYAFIELENPAAEESEITVTFEPPGGGTSHGNVTLDVGASRRWRTWAYTRAARSAGAWTAVVRGPSGEELARAPFDVTL